MTCSPSFFASWKVVPHVSEGLEPCQTMVSQCQKPTMTGDDLGMVYGLGFATLVWQS